MTRISDNFLNIQRNTVKQNLVGLNITNRSIESDLSNLTQVQNCKTETQLQVLEKIRENNSVVTELSNLKNIDCRKLIISANQQMKRINYKLSNLISNGDTHIEFLRNDPKEIEILEDIPFLCKIRCKGLSSPVKFIVKHKTKGKVKSYISMEQ